MNLDNIECLTINQQAKDFPKHYHETFCISLIRDGIEKIDLENQSLYSESGSISITNPYELHSNPLVDNFIRISFDTLYISSDLMKYLSAGKNIQFENRKINDVALNTAFINVKEAVKNPDIRRTETALSEFAHLLLPYSKLRSEDYNDLFLKNTSDVLNYIDSNLKNKISLDELARIASLNKFGFAKNFKSQTGMSPINYVLMKRIFSMKTIISPSTDLTQLAYDYNFSDLSHFSNAFKRYIGISPNEYKSQMM